MKTSTQRMRNKSNVFSLKSFFLLSDAEKQIISAKFRKEFTAQRSEWSNALAKKYVAESMMLSRDLIDYLCIQMDIMEPLHRNQPPAEYLSRRQFKCLPEDLRESLEKKIRDTVMDTSLNRGKMTLREAEKLASRELKMSVQLVRSLSPSFDMVQRKKKAKKK